MAPLPISDRPAVYARDVGALGERSNTNNARIIGIVRNVRDVRGFREQTNRATKNECRSGPQARVPGLNFKPPTSRTPRTKPMDIGVPVFVAAGTPRNYEHDQTGGPRRC